MVKNFRFQGFEFGLLVLALLTTVPAAATFRWVLEEPGPEAGLTFVESPWSVNPATQLGRLEIHAVSEYHFGGAHAAPGDQFFRSQGDLLALTGEFASEHPHLTGPEEAVTTVYTFEYIPTLERSRPNAARIKAFRDQLQTLIDQLTPNDGALGPVNAIAALFDEPSLDERRFRRLYRLLPLIHDYGKNFGGPEKVYLHRHGLSVFLDSLSDASLERIYFHDFQEEIRDRVRLQMTAAQAKAAGRGRPWLEWLASVDNSFFRSEVDRAFTPEVYVATDPTPRTLILERRPKVFHIDRGSCGKDCSRWSVPLFSYAPGAETYLIRSQANGPAKGYAFVAPDLSSESPAPYVLTINGWPMDQAETRAILQALALVTGAHELTLPNFGLNPSLVNSAHQREGMRFRESVAHQAQLPWSWQEIEDFMRRHPERFKYVNYYALTKIASARRLRLSDLATPLSRDMRWISTERVSLPRPDFERSSVATVLKAAREMAPTDHPAATALAAELTRQARGLTTEQMAALAHLATPLTETGYALPPHPTVRWQALQAIGELMGWSAETWERLPPFQTMELLVAAVERDPGNAVWRGLLHRLLTHTQTFLNTEPPAVRIGTPRSPLETEVFINRVAAERLKRLNTELERMGFSALCMPSSWVTSFTPSGLETFDPAEVEVPVVTLLLREASIRRLHDNEVFGNYALGLTPELLRRFREIFEGDRTNTQIDESIAARFDGPLILASNTESLSFKPVDVTADLGRERPSTASPLSPPDRLAAMNDFLHAAWRHPGDGSPTLEFRETLAWAHRLSRLTVADREFLRRFWNEGRPVRYSPTELWSGRRPDSCEKRMGASSSSPKG